MMKNQFFKRTAAFICALCIVGGGLPQTGSGLSLRAPGVTADAAKQQFQRTVKFDEDTGVLTLLAGNVSKSDVRELADNAGVTKVVCEEGAVLPEDSSELFEYFLAEEFDLSNADTSNVTDMNFMFNCSFAKTIDLTGWDTSKVTNMNYMFSDCSKLETIYVSSKWVVAEETTTAGTFDSCTSLTGEKGTTVDTSLLDYAEFARIDGGEEAPGYLSHNVHEWSAWVTTKDAKCGIDGEKERTCSICGEKETDVIPATGTGHKWGEWETVKLPTISEAGLKEHTCSVCGGKETEEIPKIDENHEHTWGEPTYTWSDDYSKCTAERVCSECDEKETETVNSTSKSNGFHINYTAVFTNSAFEKQTNYKFDNIDGTVWYPYSEITRETLDSYYIPQHVNAEKYITSIVAQEGCVLPKDCSFLFDTKNHPQGWLKLEKIDLSKADFSQVENMEHMFYCLPALREVIIDEADLSKVKNMSYLFDSEHIVKVVIKANEKGTPALNNMKSMFAWSSSALTSLEMSGFTTENVVNMSYLFGGCSNLDNDDFYNIDLNFDTSKVENMSGMFVGCSGITKLDLSSFDTSNVENMSEMFSGCENLKKITVGNGWNTEKVDESENMFLDCTSIKGIKGTTYDPDHIDAEYARVDTSIAPGYFTADYSAITVVDAKAATCEEPGNIAYWLDEATNKYYKDENLTQEITEEETVIPALGHKWTKWNTTPATCTESGVKTRVCENCALEEIEPIDPKGHIWSEWVVTTSATCKDDGIRKLTCETCGETESEVIPAFGGDHEWDDWKVTKKPTCVENGVKAHTCSKCGSIETMTISATGEHTWGEWETVTEPTYFKDGLKKHVCSVCGEEETEVIPVQLSENAALTAKQIDKVKAELLAEEPDMTKLSAYAVAARSTFDELTDDEKELVGNYEILVIAEKFIAAVNASGDVDELKAELEKANNTIAQLNKELEAANAAAEKAEADLAEAQKALETANADLKTANASVADLKEQLAAAEEKIAALEEGAEADEVLQKEIADLKKKLEAAKTAQSAAEKAQAAAEADAKTAKANAEKAAAAQKKAEDAQAEAEAALEKALADKANAETEAKEAAAAKAKAEADLEKVEAELESTKTELTKTKKALNTANADLKAANAKVASLEADLAAAEEKIAALEDGAEADELLQKEVADLKEKLEAARSELAEAEQSLELTDAELTAAKAKVADLEAALAEAEERIAALEDGAEADELLQKEVADLKEKLEAAKAAQAEAEKAQAAAEADTAAAKEKAAKAAAAQKSAEEAAQTAKEKAEKAAAAQAKAEKELAELKASLGTVKILVGDVDGSGSVDIKDAALLTRFYNGNENVYIDMNAADLDRDGEVTLRDVIILARCANAWDGYDKYIIEIEK